MQCVANLKTKFDELLAPGDYMFSGGEGQRPDSIVFFCPCGTCGDITSIRIAQKDTKHIPPSWDWNDNREKPTLTPSILRLDKCKWHGYLTDGVFVSC